MKKLVMFAGLLTACLLSCVNLQAISNFESFYPPVVQNIEGTVIFSGDRHNQFEGDYVAILSDGSAWKIHPDCREMYARWLPGESVRVKVRTDWYWFKREHKFALYNYNRGETVKAMIVHHKEYPIPLQIITVETYAKSTCLVAVPHYITKYRSDGTTSTEVAYHYEWEPCNFRKILGLSDGTFWVIKDKFNDFHVGSRVYIGAQGHPEHYYDFVFISGDQREAQWTYARPQK